jgi:hypothetical protein
LAAPKALVEAASRYENEQRSIEYVLLDRAQAGEIPPPAPEVLVKYFAERKNFFRAPEYRKLVVVSLIPTEQARWIEISDADLKRAYEERRARYVTPERRHVLQIDFPNAEAASAAAERITKGTSFADIAKELGKSEKDIDLGAVTKAAMTGRRPTPPSRSKREKSARRCKAGSALSWCKCSRPNPSRFVPSSRSPSSSSRSWRSRAPRPRFSTCTTRSRMRARKANRWPKPPPT